MITGFALVCVNVLDLDEAKDFYVGKLGFEVSIDMVRDGFRWLVVYPPAQPETPLMLVVPGPPVTDEATGEQMRSLVATGLLPPERRPGAEFLAWSSVHGFAMLVIDGPLHQFPRSEVEGIGARVIAMVEQGL